ncbi:MAG: cysteine hydrolase [Candidatus Hodarchaeales archaeon]|jgi:nicotinamidase-related amidase
MVHNQTIIEEWDNLKIPAPPELEEVTVESKSTALLVLDFQNLNCNQERRPRCVASLPKVQKLLSKAREKDLLIVYSLIRSSHVEDIRVEVKPLGNEPIVKAGVDKFYKTDLENILRRNDISKVIIVGTSAHGAVLHTATGAAQRQLKVIVPVDGISASDPYAEQYSVWHLANSPGTRRSVSLTKSDMIEII